MPRKKHAAHENHERWLVSYADFITLLFAFFVVMFASSQTDKGKQAQMQESVKKAFEGGNLASALEGILGGTPDDRGLGNAQMKGPGGAQKIDEETLKRAALLEAMKNLSESLAAEVRDEQVSIKMESRGLVISFHQAAFFPSGGDEIPVEAVATLEKVAETLAPLPNPVRFEGHTDSIPIKGNGRFRSNWELSAARAIAMMEALVECCGLPRERFSIGGYAENAPVADNSTDEGRGRNRRVDIVILNAEGLRAEPGRK
ncbi:MAG: flagellar motor protein MotB [Bryobacteraceae bacterium]